MNKRQITDVEQRKAAKEFAAYWKDKGYEKGESQLFWTTLLTDVFGVENAASFIEFEDQVHLLSVVIWSQSHGLQRYQTCNTKN